MCKHSNENFMTVTNTNTSIKFISAPKKEVASFAQTQIYSGEKSAVRRE